ncbi:MAG TPA: hypothetical protein VOB72_27210 [Candidatus Dormibacteraeota bacterium]|nr:hypothetical protein [Candidatus Dormibacteraeota bacterium]
MTRTAVYLEIGTKRVFACAQDWPGWCRLGKTEQQALETLAAYLPRYAPVAAEAGLAPPSDAFDVVERLDGKPAYTDFGVPSMVAAADARPVPAEQAERLAALMEAAWTVFDRVVAASPAELRKGPRGGGRDRDPMVEHVLGAEVGYGRRLGLKLRQPALGDAAAITAVRAALATAVGRPSDGGPPVPKGWPIRYAVRRIAWHVLDHAWEMEDHVQPATVKR